MPKTKKIVKLTSKVDPQNPNHHLWNNRGDWWCNFTVHTNLGTSERMRCSLQTTDLESARKRRDKIFADISHQCLTAKCA